MLSIIDKSWKWPKCPLMGKWKCNDVNNYTYYTIWPWKKGDEGHGITLMGPESQDTNLSEISQT